MTAPIASEDATLSAKLRYVLITPARNEAKSIEQTLKSVIAQTALPARWVIVSDGSTDATEEIVERYAVEHSWIRLLHLPPTSTRSFAAKVRVFNAGYASLKDLDYDVIGNLDADITFDEVYMQFLLGKLCEDGRLGVVGTPFREGTRQYDYRFTSIEHVSGACQIFRRACFEEIGGYVPSAVGGVDLIAVISARMKGWKTRSFPEKICLHHRGMGGAKHGRLMTAFKGGRGDYMLGASPFWAVARTIYQITRPPYIAAGVLRLLGFTWAMLRRTQKCVSPDLVRFRRKEQMQRLSKFFRGSWRAAHPGLRRSPSWVIARR